MVKLRRKHSMYRILKTISYLVGFPLFFMLVFTGSMSFIWGPGYDDTKLYGIIAVAAIWAVVTLIQIVFSLFMKSYKGKTALCVILSVVLIIGGAFAFDTYCNGRIEEITKENEKYDVEVENYNHQAQYFVRPLGGGLAEDLNADIASFSSLYNLSGSTKGGTNTDLSEYKEGEDGADYSENGLYADGYIFGVEQALDILITYHEVTEKYAAEGKDVDEELAKAMTALDSYDSEWYKYQQTDEYKKAYGEGGEAYKYMLSEERLGKILVALGTNLDAPLHTILSDSTVKGLINGLLEDSGLTADAIDSYIGPDLTVDQILGVVNGLGIIKNEDGTPKTLAKSDIMELLKQFSYYQMPNIYPKMHFLEDGDLRDYAYAKFYATEHGARIGSVLIGDRIGNVTMDTDGMAGEEGWDLEQLYQLRTDMSYMPRLYPVLAVRRYAYYMGAIVALSYMLYYHFKGKERKLFAEIYDGEVQ